MFPNSIKTKKKSTCHKLIDYSLLGNNLIKVKVAQMSCELLWFQSEITEKNSKKHAKEKQINENNDLLSDDPKIWDAHTVSKY